VTKPSLTVRSPVPINTLFVLLNKEAADLGAETAVMVASQGAGSVVDKNIKMTLMVIMIFIAW
jgi:hypothetical protein